jgi:hypothetical protein
MTFFWRSRLVNAFGTPGVPALRQMNRFSAPTIELERRFYRDE